MDQITPAKPNELITTTARPLDQHPAAVYLAGLTPTGRRGMITALMLVTRTLTNGHTSDFRVIDWGRVRFQHLAAVRAALMDHYAPTTVNHALSAVRGVLKAAWQLGHISGEEYQKAAAVKAINNDRLPAGRELSQGEIAALMAECEKDHTAAGVRDGAIIALLYACGLRRAELTTLTTGDYNQETGRLLINGKGGKQRTAYLTNGVLYAVADWLQIRGNAPGPLFYAINKGGIILDHGITPQAVYYVLARRAAGAGVTEFSPHDLRRTFVSDLLDAGADIATVSKMAGHSNVNTTARYDRRPEEQKEKAARLLHVPYKRRK